LFELYSNKIIKKQITGKIKWIINNIAKNMKSFIEINFKDDINDNILCFLDYIFIITSKNHILYSHIIGFNYSTDDLKISFYYPYFSYFFKMYNSIMFF